VTIPSAETARVTVFVAVDPATAFRIFTEETDLWWKRGARYRFGEEHGVIRFDGGAEGRLVEIFADGDVFEVGKIRIWEPGSRVAFSWRGRGFGPADSTEVDVTVSADRLELRVADDGVGLPATVSESGLRNARRRADDLGGTLEVSPVGERGTVLIWRVPLG